MRHYIFLFLVFASINSYGQSNKENAKNKLDKAIELMDNGSPDQAIQLIDEAK
jgi:hypothetical protein